MHKGKVVIKTDKYTIIDCEICGFKHLDPIPTEEDLEKFYKREYLDLVKKGERAPEIRRLMSGGEEARSELKWLESTLYNDIHKILTKYLPKEARELCDIGCGTGHFLKYMSKKGWKCIGIEPSQEGSKIGKELGLAIYPLTLKEFIDTYPNMKNTFDAVTLLNVLEHVSSPFDFLNDVKKLLKPHTGIICIRVPNDFNKLQIYIQKRLKKTPWWVAVPEHINYFNITTLQKLLASLGMDIVYKTTDFPMELFLLMGYDYVNNPKIGSLCHNKRVKFELLLPNVIRRNLYKVLAAIGIGRDCLVFAKVKS